MKADAQGGEAQPCYKKNLWITRRIGYAAAFLVTLGIEVLIALYVHDIFVRPYIGDVLVVVVLYCLLRVIIPVGVKLLPMYIFVFAASVEGLQYLNLVKRLGLEANALLRTMIGSTFDWMDIGCYTAGCILLAVWEIIKTGYASKRR